MYAVIRTLHYGDPAAPDDKEEDVFLFLTDAQANKWVDEDYKVFANENGITAFYLTTKPVDMTEWS